MGARSTTTRAVKWMLCGCCLALATMAWSMEAGKTAQGLAFTSGGVSIEELSAMHAKRESYNLWVVTAALGSGAHLADVRLVIRDDKSRVVFDRRLQGPWLFIDLPLGRYELEASAGKESQKRITTIHQGDLHQTFFYFATGDELSPEYRSPFPGSPYAAKRP
jgi:hypothetical protein